MHKKELYILHILKESPSKNIQYFIYLSMENLFQNILMLLNYRLKVNINNVKKISYFSQKYIFHIIGILLL